MHLSWIDIGIVLVYVGGTILAGTIARSAIKNISDFLVAGRSLKTHMAGATIVSTGLGLGMLIGALLTQKSCPPRPLDFRGME